MFVKNQGGLGKGKDEKNKTPKYAPVEPGVGSAVPMEDKSEHVFAGDWGPGGTMLKSTPGTVEEKPTDRGGRDAGLW